ncbi:hypothetical protein pb186bvf_011750 [Paramecium bursaria]
MLNIRSSRLLLNHYGFFKYLKDRQKKIDKIEELYINYEMAQNYNDKLLIYKNVIDLREQLEGQNKTSLDTIYSLRQYIQDYELCKLEKIEVNKECQDYVIDVKKKFSDSQLFEKITYWSMFQNYLQGGLPRLQKMLFEFDQLEFRMGENGLVDLQLTEQLTNKMIYLNQQISQYQNRYNVDKFYESQEQKAIFEYERNSKCLWYQSLLHTNKLEFQESVECAEQALEQIMKAYQLNKQIDGNQQLQQIHLDMISSIIQSFADLKVWNNLHEQSLEYFEQALNILRESQGITIKYANCFIEMIFVKSLKNPANAIEQIDLVINQIEKNSPQYLILSLGKSFILFQQDKLKYSDWHQMSEIQKIVKYESPDYNFDLYNLGYLLSIRLSYFVQAHSQLLDALKYLKQINIARQSFEVVNILDWIRQIQFLSVKDFKSILGQLRTILDKSIMKYKGKENFDQMDETHQLIVFKTETYQLECQIFDTIENQNYQEVFDKLAIYISRFKGYEAFKYIQLDVMNVFKSYLQQKQSDNLIIMVNQLAEQFYDKKQK